MKKILLAFLTISAVFALNTANAQWCGIVNDSIANPNTPLGFPNSDSIPCATQGVAYSYNIAFQMYSSFTFEGVHQLDSITIDTIYNLPCGLCWSLNKASRTYYPNELGSLVITGNTSDMVGQYNLRLEINAYLTGGGGAYEYINPATVDAAGIKIWLRVAAPGGMCDSVKTGINDTDQTTAIGCTAGINEVEANVASINIMPNPVSSNATLSFTAERSAAYAVKIADITGKIISVKQINAAPGLNTSTIERGTLSAGIYFLSLSNGVSSVTRKFIISE